MQQRARLERLNSRKWKSQNYTAVRKASEKCIACKPSSIADESFVESLTTNLTPVVDDKELSTGLESENLFISSGDDGITLRNTSAYEGKCSCDAADPLQTPKEIGGGCNKCNEFFSSLPDAIDSEEECLSSEVCSSISKSKRHSDRDLDNPKPRKYRRPTCNHSDMSSKYSRISFCGIDDYLQDGFYDAGRDRPFMPLSSYEKNIQLDSREVILVDR